MAEHKPLCDSHGGDACDCGAADLELARGESSEAWAAYRKAADALAGWEETAEHLTEQRDVARRELSLQSLDVERLTRERDEARAWVDRMRSETQVLTCVYCGQAYPPGSPTHGAEVLTEHIKVCEKHPMREAEERIRRLTVDLENALFASGSYMREEQAVLARAAKLEEDRDAGWTRAMSQEERAIKAEDEVARLTLALQTTEKGECGHEGIAHRLESLTTKLTRVHDLLPKWTSRADALEAGDPSLVETGVANGTRYCISDITAILEGP